MKLKAAVKYQLWEARYSVLIYYGCVLAIFTAFALLSPDKSHVSGGNIEWISSIFLFIAGIATFSVEFKLYMQSGLHRDLLSKSVLITFLLGSFIMLAGDLLVQAFFMSFPIEYMSSISLAFPSSGFLSQCFLHYSMLFCMSYIGYLIGAIYYRLNKLFGILFCILLPIMILFSLSSFTVTYTAENPNTAGIVLDRVVAYIAQSPIHLGVFLCIIAAISAFFSHLITRKAQLK